MDRLKNLARLMIVLDIDHTMVDHHDAEDLSLLRFNTLWESNYHYDSLLVFSIGRSPTLYKELRKEKPMLTPYITIISVGTEITYGNSMIPDEGWVEYLNQKWDKNIVTEEVEMEIRPHKVSFYFVVKIIYSGGMDLDILSQGAGKGQALAYLLKKFKIEGKFPVNTLVCGDFGNDVELFSIPDVHGVMVAAGIIQAIGHFHLGPNISPRYVIDFSECSLENVNPGHEMVKFNLFYEKWRRGEIDYNMVYIASLKADCCTICSICMFLFIVSNHKSRIHILDMWIPIIWKIYDTP
ncbi:hypothetical protein UlMin_037259 [Ulmus minor]